MVTICHKNTNKLKKSVHKELLFKKNNVFLHSVSLEHMKQTLHIFFIVISILLFSCKGKDTKDAVAKSTSDDAFTQSLRTADSLYNHMQFRDAYDLYLQLLDNKVVEADSEKKLNVLNSICNCGEFAGHKADQNKWLEQLISLAKQMGNDYYHAMGLGSMGVNLFYEGDREKGIQYIQQAIDLLEKTNRPDADHLVHSHLILLARLYGEVKDYDNAQKTNERNLQLTMQGTRWGSAPSQQFIDRRMALSKMASLSAKMQDFQRADSAYTAWKAVQYEGNHTRDYFIVDYLKNRGRYTEAIPIYNTLIDRIRQQGDTLGEMMNTAKWGLAEVYHKMGNFKQAANLYEQVLDIQDTLKSRKARNTAMELAAIYHDKEQEQIIIRQDAENTRQRHILAIGMLALFSVTVLAIITLMHNRSIKRKNRFLAQQITDAVKYKKMYREEIIKQAQTNVETPQDPNTLSDEQLFQHIHEIIVQEQLFLDPNFGRQTIMDRFQLSKERVGAVFSKGSEHAKMSNYVQQLRLEYAARLLTTELDKNIVEIASECGFSSSTYFTNCFRQHFGIRPTEFRRNAEESAGK